MFYNQSYMLAIIFNNYSGGGGGGKGGIPGGPPLCMNPDHDPIIMKSYYSKIF